MGGHLSSCWLLCLFANKVNIPHFIIIIIIVWTEAGLYGLYFHTIVKRSMYITIDRKFKQLQYCGFWYQLCWHDNYKLNSTQPEITDAGVNTFMSTSLCSRFLKNSQLITTPDRFPVSVRSAVKSNLTNWCDQNLSNHALNVLTVLGRLFKY